MKILIVNDKLIGGGAELQSRREKDILEEKGHKVWLLTFEYNYPKNDNRYNIEHKFYNIPIKDFGVNKILNKLCFRIGLYLRIRKVIKSINPDVIHVNNLYIASKTQFTALKRYKVIQTIRDYSAVCPKSTCIYLDNSICNGSKYNDCRERCGEDIKTKFKMSISNRNNKYRKKYVSKFLCPSEKLTKYCEDHDYRIKCINNPFDLERFSSFKKDIIKEKKSYLYYGNINHIKGVKLFIESFIKYSRDKNIELLLAGKIDKDIKNDINKYIENEKIKYLGYLAYEDMIKILKGVYAIVVPSLWMENYPNTVLEGQATGTLVLGSNRGGITDMLDDGRGLLFNVTDSTSIIETLEKSGNLTNDEYMRIVECSKNYVMVNNSFDKFYKKLISEFEEE